MRLKLIIGVLALLLLMVGSASAETFTLNEANELYFQGKIEIQAICDEANGKIDVKYISDDVPETPLGIDIVYYNLDKDTGYIVTKVMEGTVDTTNSWHLNFDGDVAAAGTDWGHFSSHQSKDSAGSTGINKPITFILEKPFLRGIPANEAGRHVAVHIRFSDDKSTWVTDGNPPEPPEPPTQVPEFPSVALPIASIIGILFIFGRKKQE